MRFARYIFLVAFVLFFAISPSKAQIGYYSDKDSTGSIQDFDKNSTIWKSKRLGFSMEMGVGVSGSTSGLGTYTYLAPFLNYRVSPRFRLDVGAVYMQGFNNFYSNEFQNYDGNNSNLSLFVRGNYIVSDKLLISGAVYNTFDFNRPQTSDLNVQKKTFDNYGIMVGAEYKITENLTIGAQLNISNRNTNGYSPYYQDNYFGGFQQGYNSHNPFNRNRFNSGFGGW